MSNDTVQQIEESIRQSKETIEFDKALQRLTLNKDFNLVIKDGYLKDEAIRLVHLKADPSMQTPERQAAIVRDLDAIGGLLSYFRTVGANAVLALKSIEMAEATRDELLGEELN